MRVTAQVSRLLLARTVVNCCSLVHNLLLDKHFRILGISATLCFLQVNNNRKEINIVYNDRLIYHACYCRSQMSDEMAFSGFC